MAQKAIAAGIPGEQVDGNDVIAVYDRFDKALARARSGQGPSLIEPVTYRMRDHTTADDARRYRSAEEVEEQRKLDPIVRLKKYLVEQNVWDNEQEAQLATEVGAEVEAATKEYLDTPPRPPQSIFDCLYETLPKAYTAQRRQLSEGDDTDHA